MRIPQTKRLESFQTYAPEVVRLADGTYRMYYAGWIDDPTVKKGSPYNGRIFSAASKDGLGWTKDEGLSGHRRAVGPCQGLRTMRHRPPRRAIPNVL